MFKSRIGLKKTVEKVPSNLDKGFDVESQLEDFDSGVHSM